MPEDQIYIFNISEDQIYLYFIYSMKKHILADVSRSSSQNIQSVCVNKNLMNDIK